MCFLIYEKRSFEWDYAHLSSFTLLGAIGQKKMILSAPSKIHFTDILRERCNVNSWSIFKNYTSYVIYEQRILEWDYAHLSSLNRLGLISQRR